MSDHPNARTVEAIEKMMETMQYLVDHPRMQQRNWVAAGRRWLPVLQHAKEDLQRGVIQHDNATETANSLLSALARVGLAVEKRDAETWGYRWHDGALTGSYLTRADAVEAGLKERIK